MNDKLLRSHCIQELDFLPQIEAAHIGVAVEDGVVTLTGHVASYAEKVAAEQAILRLRGVRAVAERIEVRRPEDLRLDDEELAGRCASVIAWDTSIPSDSIVVKVEKGCVTLTGWVERYDEKTAADRALRRLAGIVDIVNTVGVRRPTTAEAPAVRHREQAAP